LSVSGDAIVRDKPQDKPKEQQQGAEPESSEPNGHEISSRVSLDQTTMQVEERVVDLTPSMAVTVEIKTGSRR
jgi:hemolysin D